MLHGTSQSLSLLFRVSLASSLFMHSRERSSTIRAARSTNVVSWIPGYRDVGQHISTWNRNVEGIDKLALPRYVVCCIVSPLPSACVLFSTQLCAYTKGWMHLFHRENCRKQMQNADVSVKTRAFVLEKCSTFLHIYGKKIVNRCMIEETDYFSNNKMNLYKTKYFFIVSELCSESMFARANIANFVFCCHRRNPWLLNKYCLLLEPRGTVIIRTNMNMSLYLCMQTRLANQNQIARGFVLT